jgi:hypothetical protein
MFLRPRLLLKFEMSNEFLGLTRLSHRGASASLNNAGKTGRLGDATLPSASIGCASALACARVREKGPPSADIRRG